MEVVGEKFRLMCTKISGADAGMVQKEMVDIACYFQAWGFKCLTKEMAEHLASHFKSRSNPEAPRRFYVIEEPDAVHGFIYLHRYDKEENGGYKHIRISSPEYRTSHDDILVFINPGK